jgi:hypothetical protein
MSTPFEDSGREQMMERARRIGEAAGRQMDDVELPVLFAMSEAEWICLAARAMTMHSPVPPNADLLGWIDRHPADDHGPGYAVLRFVGGGESAWNGESIRSLPPDWRTQVYFEPKVDHISAVDPLYAAAVRAKLT